MDLDLGQRTEINVKVGGESYKVLLPTVEQVQDFQKEMKELDSEEQNVLLFRQLLGRLGFPEDVELDFKQYNRLSEGILGVVEKK